MANKSRIKSMAKELNLQTIANGQFKELGMGNLDYLEMMLKQELEYRKRNVIAKVRKHSNLPTTVFDKQRLNSGLRYQVEKLISCEWINNCRNLVIIGGPNTGKTALATYLTNNAIEKGFKAMYIKMADIFMVLQQKDSLYGANTTFNRIKNTDLIVLDEVLYFDISKETLETLYRIIMSLNETTSIVFIANREISEWLANAETIKMGEIPSENLAKLSQMYTECTFVTKNAGRGRLTLKAHQEHSERGQSRKTSHNQVLVFDFSCVF